jgi:hypothetical protein
MQTLANAPKQEERKLNLHLTGFEAKEGETKKELVQQFNTELLQGQMRLRAKVIAATRQRLVTVWAFAPTAGVHLNAMLLKFSMSEDRQAALRGRKGLAGTKLGLDEDLMPCRNPTLAKCGGEGQHSQSWGLGVLRDS